MRDWGGLQVGVKCRCTPSHKPVSYASYATRHLPSMSMDYIDMVCVSHKPPLKPTSTSRLSQHAGKYRWYVAYNVMKGLLRRTMLSHEDVLYINTPINDLGFRTVDRLCSERCDVHKHLNHSSSSGRPV